MPTDLRLDPKTIRAISVAADCHPSTVERFLRLGRDRVRPAGAARIERAIAQIGGAQ